MFVKNITLIISGLLAFSNYCYSQSESDGYWDQVRKTEKRFALPNGSRTYVKVDIPVGTTQFVYRISFIDENTPIRESLASVIGSVPYAPAKGAAATLNLLNLIGGSNKGNYFIFTNIEDANYFYNEAAARNTCYYNNNDVSGDKNVIYLDQSRCLTESTRSLYFAFHNANEFDDFNVVLEVLPWVDKKASRGWTKSIKSNFYQKCVTGAKSEDQSLNPEDFCFCLLSKLEENYYFNEFIKLSEIEQNKLYEQAGEECIVETGVDEILIDNERDKASELLEQGKYKEAIEILIYIIESGYADELDYNIIGYSCILTKQYSKAIKYLLEGEKIDEYDLLIKGNLAHAYLLNYEKDKAISIYLKYKNQNIDDEMSWIEMVETDFATFKELGIQSSHFEEVLKLIKE